jgi:Rieske 2Fe-2S family protein
MSTYANTRPEIPVETLTLQASYYTDPAHFAREMDAIHFAMWLYGGRTAELPAAGSYVVRKIANANVLVVRGEDGQLRAFHNVCRHRGTLLCKEEEGTLAGRIQCSYHAWTYGLDGALCNAPHMEKVTGFRNQDFPLLPVAVGEWDGHFFLNISESPSPLAEQLDDLPGRFAPWHMAELARVERRVYDLKANWKLVIQNYSECLHCPIVHPQLQKYSHYMSGDNAPAHPSYMGGRMGLREGIATLSTDGTMAGRSCFADLDADARRHVYYYCLLPNMFLNLHPDYMMTFAIWPQAVDRTQVVCEWHFHPDEIAKPGFDPKGTVEFWDVTNKQDWELSDMAQEGIASRGYRPGPYSNREELLFGLDRFVLDRLER